VVTDMKMPRMGGLELLEKLATDAQTIAVIVVTAQGTIDSAVSSHAYGRVLTTSPKKNPIDTNRFFAAHPAKCHGPARTRTELEIHAPEAAAMRVLWGGLIGSPRKCRRSSPHRDGFASTASVAHHWGQRHRQGTGGPTVHELSPRRNKPFVPINCAAIPETLIESEISATKRAPSPRPGARTGCFELAEGGTLLLDEIGEMPVATQAKLLRVLEDRKLRRLGSKVGDHSRRPRLAATNKVPEKLSPEANCVTDPYYRLNVLTFTCRPCRRTQEDVSELGFKHCSADIMRNTDEGLRA